MKGYEYIRIKLDMSDLAELNRLSSTGWRVSDLIHDGKTTYALLERELQEKEA